MDFRYMNNHSYKVLLVDDSQTDYLLAAHYLEEYKISSFDVDWASSYREGLNKALSQDYDFCLFDYRLGMDNGMHLAKQLREQGFEKPILLYSGEGLAKISVNEDFQLLSGYVSKNNLSTETIMASVKDAISGLDSKYVSRDYKRKGHKHKKRRGLIFRKWVTKIFCDPDYININDNYFHRDLFK